MNNIRKGQIVVILTIMLMAAQVSFADIYLEQKTSSSKNGGNESYSKLYISPDAIRIEEPGDKIVNITDFQGQRLVTVDTENKEFFTIPLSQIKEDIGRASASFKNSVQMSWRVENTGEVRTIAGYQARQVIFHGRGTTVQQLSSEDSISITLEFWVGIDVPIPDEINNRILDALGIEQNPFVTRAIVDEMRKMGGYPLMTVTKIDMASVKDEVVQEVTLLTEIAPEPQRYQVPADYQEVEAN